MPPSSWSLTKEQALRELTQAFPEPKTNYQGFLNDLAGIEDSEVHTYVESIKEVAKNHAS